MLSHTTQYNTFLRIVVFLLFFFFLLSFLSFFSRLFCRASWLGHFHFHFRCFGAACVLSWVLHYYYIATYYGAEYRVCTVHVFRCLILRHSRTIEFWFSGCDASQPKMTDKLQFKRVLNDRQISTTRDGRTHASRLMRLVRRKVGRANTTQRTIVADHSSMITIYNSNESLTQTFQWLKLWRSEI